MTFRESENTLSELNLSEERIRDSGAFPKVILLDTTNHCNLRCSMCGHRLMTRKKGTMSMTLFRKIIDEIAEVDPSVRVWMVFFGEALILRYKLLWMILYAKRKGLTDVVLNTNGNLLDEEMVSGLIESGLDAIYIGIDAFKPETYKKYRVGGDYNRVVKNVKQMLETKRKMCVPNPRIYVQFVEMEENANEKDDFVKYWSDLGAIVKIRPKVSWAGAVEAKNLTSKNRHPCYWAMQCLPITWDGKAVLCAVDFDAQFVAGDVNNKSIQSIWLGKHRELRKLHLNCEYDLLPNFCRDCKDWQAAQASFYGE